MMAFVNEFEPIPPSKLDAVLDPGTGKLHHYTFPNPGTLQEIGEPFIAESVWVATKGNSRFDAMRVRSWFFFSPQTKQTWWTLLRLDLSIWLGFVQ